MRRGWTTLLGAALLAASPAIAKKPKPPKEAPVEAAPAAPAQQLGANPQVQISATSGGEVEVPCGYVPGEVHRYEAVKTSTETQAGRPDKRVSYRYEMAFTVVSHSGPVTVVDLAYTPITYTIPPPDPIEAAVVEEMAAATAIAPLRLEIDHEKRERRIQNPEELTKLGGQMATQVRASLGARLEGVPDDVKAQIFAMTDAMATNPGLLQAGVLEDVVPTFGFSCSVFPAGETTYTAQFPNPLGGPVLSGSGALVTSIDKEGRVQVRDGTVLDPVAAEAIMRPLLEKAGVPMPAELEGPMMDIRNGLELSLSATDGWPERWTSEKAVRMVGASKIEQLQVSRMTD